MSTSSASSESVQSVAVLDCVQLTRCWKRSCAPDGHQLIPATGVHWYAYGFGLRGVLAAQSIDGNPHDIDVGDRGLRSRLHNISKRRETRQLVLEYQNVRFAFIAFGYLWPQNMRKRDSEANEAHNRQELDRVFERIIREKGDLNSRPPGDVWGAEQLRTNSSDNDYTDNSELEETLN